MNLKNIKVLFSRTQYPLHSAFFQMLMIVDDSEVQVDYSFTEIHNIAKLMGADYVRLVELMIRKESYSTLLNFSLALKVSAKQTRTNTGREFINNTDELVIAISQHVTIDFKTPFQQQKERVDARKADFIKKQKLVAKKAKRRETPCNNRYVSFPEFGIRDIKRDSKADKTLRNLLKGFISDADYLWLKIEMLVNPIVNNYFYIGQANRYSDAWLVSSKPWNLVNALANYRKGNDSKSAVELIKKYYPYRFANGNKKLKSALLTTTGGVKRDLNLFSDAVELGKQAHLLVSSDYRPCTLIGAAYILLGEVSEGHFWYKKAISLGFKSRSYESEIKAIYLKATKEEKRKISEVLRSEGYSYLWLN